MSLVEDLFEIDESLLNLKIKELEESLLNVKLKESLNNEKIHRNPFDYQSCSKRIEERILKYLENEGSISVYSLKLRVIPNNILPSNKEFLKILKPLKDQGLLAIDINKVVTLNKLN